jgi:hypothetical protein
MKFWWLLLVIIVLSLPYCINAQSTTSSITTYGLIDIIGIIVLILIVVFAYALQKRRSQMLKIKNATQKQKIDMLNKEYMIVMKEGAKLQQEGGMLKKDYMIVMKEGAKLQQEREMLKKKLSRMKKNTMKAKSR